MDRFSTALAVSALAVSTLTGALVVGVLTTNDTQQASVTLALETTAPQGGVYVVPEMNEPQISVTDTTSSNPENMDMPGGDSGTGSVNGVQTQTPANSPMTWDSSSMVAPMMDTSKTSGTSEGTPSGSVGKVDTTQTTTPLQGGSISPSRGVTHDTKDKSRTTQSGGVQPNAAAIRELDAQKTSTSPATMSSAEKEQKMRLENMGTTVKSLNTQTKKLQKDLGETIDTNVDSALTTASDRYLKDASSEEAVRGFSIEDRQKKLEEIKKHVQEKKAELKVSVSDNLQKTLRGNEDFSTLEKVLKSSLDDITLLLNEEFSTNVDLSSGARTINSVIETHTEKIAHTQEMLRNRDGLDLYKDTDQDGVSDYDENNIYDTDPKNAFTSGSSLTDGERILLGFDPLKNDAILIPVESALHAGNVVTSVFEVHAISVKKAVRKVSSTPPPMGENSEDTNEVATSTSLHTTSAEQEEKSGVVEKTSSEEISVLTFEGKGLPNGFVTLYIYSTPIVVTVKADDTGSWSYTLDKELEDGNHELYLASVNNAGRIIAKSPAVPFVKTAEAVSFTPLSISEVTPVSPIDVLKNNLFIVAFLLLVVCGFVVLVTMGLWRIATARRNNVAEPQ